MNGNVVAAPFVEGVVLEGFDDGEEDAGFIAKDTQGVLAASSEKKEGKKKKKRKGKKNKKEHKRRKTKKRRKKKEKKRKCE